MVQLHIIVFGKVQGVGYRYFAQMKAIQYRITGWARNLADGSVEIVASGEKEVLNQFTKILQEGNPFSKVTDIQIQTKETAETFHSFKIRY